MDDVKEHPEYYEEVRRDFTIWTADISGNEEYLAEKAFESEDYDTARRWGNHLLKILLAKRDANERA